MPRRVTIDNAKCAITKACAKDPTVQRAYAECAEGYGFKIDPCPPYDPQKKGIVESGVKYVKGNFLALREFRNLADLNEQARAWVTTSFPSTLPSVLVVISGQITQLIRKRQSSTTNL